MATEWSPFGRTSWLPFTCTSPFEEQDERWRRNYLAEVWEEVGTMRGAGRRLTLWRLAAPDASGSAAAGDGHPLSP